MLSVPIRDPRLFGRLRPPVIALVPHSLIYPLDLASLIFTFLLDHRCWSAPPYPLRPDRCAGAIVRPRWMVRARGWFRGRRNSAAGLATLGWAIGATHPGLRV